MRIGALIALSCFCGVTTVAAQDRGVPKDLVLSLLTHHLPSDTAQNVEILIGKAPPNLSLPKLDLPIVGSLKSADGVTIVYRVAGDLAEAHRRARSIFQADGWKQHALPEQPDHGFVGVEAEIIPFMPWCRGNAMAMLETAMVRRDLRVLKVTYSEMGACGHGEVMGVGWTGYAPAIETPLPKLEPPKNAEVIGSAIPNMVSVFTTSAFVVSDLTTAQIMDHYGAQMLAKGWSSRGATVGEFSTVHTWRIAENGKEWMASMTATKLPERRHVVEVSVYNLTQLGR